MPRQAPYTRGDSVTGWLVIIVIGFLMLLSGAPGCSEKELADYASRNPKAAPTTQKLEQFERKLDVVAEKTDATAKGVAVLADSAKAAGVPGTDWVKMVALLVSGATGGYLTKRGKRTTP